MDLPSEEVLTGGAGIKQIVDHQKVHQRSGGGGVKYLDAQVSRLREDSSRFRGDRGGGFSNRSDVCRDPKAISRAESRSCCCTIDLCRIYLPEQIGRDVACSLVRHYGSREECAVSLQDIWL